MKEIVIIIERSKDAFWGYAENYKGISGVGDTLEEVKKSILENININIDLGNISSNFLSKYKLVYKLN